MYGPVNDVKVRDHAVRDIFYDEEMVRLVSSSVAALTIPIRLAVSIDRVTLGSGNCDV